MDSMRSLNTSLPSAAPPRRHTGQQTNELLSVFKSAALSVTNLYKAAATDRAQAHESGYQDALDDLLSFLDKEGVGQTEGGEGWKVRQWITDRLSGSGPASSDSDDDVDEDPKRARSSSPILQRKPSNEALHPSSNPVADAATITARPESAPPLAEHPSALAPSAPTELFTIPQQSEFTFRSSQPYPNEMDLESAETSTPANAATNMPSMRLEVFPRTSRASRHNTRNNRSPSALGLGTLGHGAGLKRRVPFDNFFDISSLGNGKDGPGGGKRGRFT